jgi:hypothetical protein
MHQYQNQEMEMMDLEMIVVMVLDLFAEHVVEQIEEVVVEMDDLVWELELFEEDLIDLLLNED